MSDLYERPEVKALETEVREQLPELAPIDREFAGLIYTDSSTRLQSYNVKFDLTCRPVPYTWIRALYDREKAARLSADLRETLSHRIKGVIEVACILRTADERVVLRARSIEDEIAESEPNVRSYEFMPTWKDFVKVGSWDDHRNGFISKSVLAKATQFIKGNQADSVELPKDALKWTGVFTVPASCVLTCCVQLPVKASEINTDLEHRLWPMPLIHAGPGAGRFYDVNVSDAWQQRDHEAGDSFRFDFESREIVSHLKPSSA